MKILVFSDSHHCRWEMLDAITAEQPDMILHLGDLMTDAQDIKSVHPTIPLVCVPGNCDGWTTEPAQKLITVASKKLLLSHGHLWGVKSGYDTAIFHGHKAGADIVLFGHTHQAHCQKLDDGMWVLNPGASRSSYSCISIEYDTIRCDITNV